MKLNYKYFSETNPMVNEETKEYYTRSLHSMQRR